MPDTLSTPKSKARELGLGPDFELHRETLLELRTEETLKTKLCLSGA